MDDESTTLAQRTQAIEAVSRSVKARKIEILEWSEVAADVLAIYAKDIVYGFTYTIYSAPKWTVVLDRSRDVIT
jgi:transcription antitermination factor NusA-like protein